MNSIAKALSLNTGLALIVPAAMWCFNPAIPGRILIRTFWISFTYANSVGFLFELFLSHVWIRSMHWHPVKTWMARLLTFFLLATAGTLTATGILYVLGVAGSYWEFFWDGYRFALLVTAIASATITIYETLKFRLEATTLELKQKELERERATKLITAATLSSLESRIHPHFLFNTINSISSLIHEDPQKAERLLGNLADLLRFSLDAPQLGLVPVSHEMKIVGDFLEIEKARLGERLSYLLEWDPSLKLRVPPLSIQTLVENSIKYAIAPRREGGSVTVRLAERGGSLEIQVEDDGPGFDLSAIPSGHGIENVEARLKTLFGGHPGIVIRNPGRADIPAPGPSFTSGSEGCIVQFTVPQI